VQTVRRTTGPADREAGVAGRSRSEKKTRSPTARKAQSAILIEAARPVRDRTILHLASSFTVEPSFPEVP